MDFNTIMNGAANAAVKAEDEAAAAAALEALAPEQFDAEAVTPADESEADRWTPFGFRKPWPKTLAECELPEFVPKMLDAMRYDPRTGKVWNRHSNPREPHSCLTTIGRGGFGRVTFYGLSAASAKVVWFLHHCQWPTGQLRHKDDDKGNDRIENLCEVNSSFSTLELIKLPGGLRRVRKNPSRGVARCGPNHWQAYCRIDGKQKALGRFNTEAEALAARAAWEKGEDLV